MSRTILSTTLPRLGALALATTLALSACSSSETESTPAEPGQTQSGQAGATQGENTQATSTSIADAWVKSADEGMTAAFGVVTNDSDEPVTIVSASTAAAPMVELHQTSMDDEGSMSMSEVDGGFVIDAGESLTLEPGGFHIMLMGVTEPIVAGQMIDVELTFSDDSTLTFEAPAKEFAGANEEYSGDGMDMDMDMDS